MDEDPETLRAYAKLFEKMSRPTSATQSAARALRFMADEIERELVVDVDHATALNNERDKLAATG
jgi:hypothetical protein